MNPPERKLAKHTSVYRQKVKSKNYFAQVSNSTTKFLSVCTVMFTVQGKKCKSKLMMTNADFLVVRGEKKAEMLAGTEGFLEPKARKARS